MQLSAVLERFNGAIQRRFADAFEEDISVVLALAVVLLVAVMNFLISLNEPHHPVWDESYYLTAISRYEQGTTQFASHPPLGLMLLAGGDLLLHPNRSIDTKRIGWDKQISDEKLPKGYSFGGIRFMSGVFASLGGVAFFALMLCLTRSPSRAVFFSCFYLFENAFVAHFRAAQLDAFQICFEIAALLCLVLALRRGPQRMPWAELGFGAAIGLASMVKLNAIVLAPLGAMLLFYRLWTLWRVTPRAQLLLTALRDGLVMTAGCLIVVFGCFTAHIVAGTHPPEVKSPAGEKDAGFISRTYWAYLHHQRGLSPAVVVAASLDYWHFMQSDLKGMPMVDANGSKPITWPLHIGAINYRWDSTNHLTSYVQLAGNVLSWWMALVALVATPVLLVLAWWRPVEDGETWRRALMAMLLLQYLIYMGVHIYLGSMRVMYLYHYFIALVMTFVLVPLVLAEAASRWSAVRARQDAILSGMVIAIVASFAFYSPLSFHRPLSTGACQIRNVLQQIVKCQ